MVRTATSTLFTIGHSTRPLAEFLALLEASHIQCVVDVRRLPGSRAFPQYDAAALRQSLHRAGVAYVWAKVLGGRRGRSLPADDMRNGYWNNASFRHYADYALDAPFAAGLQRLERRAGEARCVLMCAEAVWWRCHRRIIADYLLVHGHTVFHVMGPDKIVPARLTPGACPHDGKVFYPRSKTETGT